MEKESSQHHNAPKLSVNSRPPRQTPIEIDQSQYLATQDLDDDLIDQDIQSRELDDDELADIFCILHPASESAINAVRLIAERHPELTLNKTPPEANVRENDISTGKDDDTHPYKFSASNASYAATTPKQLDLVLRLSKLPKDPLKGFCFGRHAKNDFQLQDPNYRLSNSHFQIYINEHGVIMLEDTSRNGTQVDNQMLRVKEKENNMPYRRTLTNGSMITVFVLEPGADWRFVVRIPQREGDVEAEYENNLNEYFIRLNDLKAKKAEEANPASPVLFRHALSENGTPNQSVPPLQHSVSDSKVSRRTRDTNWKGGDRYNIVRKIGKGSFAVVYKVTRKDDGKAFAAKELDKRRFIKDGVLDDKIGNELRIMARIHHENVVQFVEVVDFNNHLYLIMDLIQGGDLGQYIQATGVLQEDQAREMTKQLLSAVEYLHGCGITHRDIKPDNIMLSNHQPIQAKLTDFGLSKMIADHETFLRTFCGTLLYCAPEVYHDFHRYDRNGEWNPKPGNRRREREPYSHSCDLWSLAAVLFYTLCKEPPFSIDSASQDYHDLLHQIMTGPLDIRPLQRKGLSETCIQFLKAMLQKWPELRPSIAQLQAHAWITGAPASQGSSDEDDEVGTTQSEETTVVAESRSQLSQLSVQDNEQEEYAYLDEIDRNNLQLSMQRSIEIPSSVKSGRSSSGESFAFMNKKANSGRLFGELGESAFGSSGVIPNQRLTRRASPLGTNHSTSASHSAASTSNSNIDPLFRTATGALARVQSTGHSEPQDAQSLLGFDSEFGHLELMTSTATSPQSEVPESPAAAQSPEGSAHHDPTQSFVTAPSTSIRRQREATDNYEPAPKRHKRSLSEYPVDKTEFWDPRNPTTWHNAYPNLTRKQFNALRAEAKAQGKVRYIPPRTTKTPLYSRTGHGDECVWPTPLVNPTRKHSSSRKADTVAQSDSFQVPCRILAKLVGQQGTALPFLAFNITEQFTSWGRDPSSTIVYSKNMDARVPRNAWQLVLWSPGRNAEETLEAADSIFYISSKASGGLRLNGEKCIPGYDNAEPRKWAQLNHGDVLTVFHKAGNPNNSVALRFECYFGASKYPRFSNGSHVVMAEGDCRKGLEAIAVCREKEMKAKYERNQVDHSDSVTTLRSPLSAEETTSKLPEDGASAHEVPLNTVRLPLANSSDNEVNPSSSSTVQQHAAANANDVGSLLKKVNAESTPGESFLSSGSQGLASFTDSEASTEHA